MNDTSPDITHQVREMMMQRSGEERLKMGCSMHETAKELVRASILANHPAITPPEMRRAIFLRFYGHEFDSETCRKIIDALTR